jgi:hypothetical protein
MVHPTPEQAIRAAVEFSSQADRRSRGNHRDFDAARPIGTSANALLRQEDIAELFPVFSAAFVLAERAIDDGS